MESILVVTWVWGMVNRQQFLSGYVVSFQGNENSLFDSNDEAQ